MTAVLCDVTPCAVTNPRRDVAGSLSVRHTTQRGTPEYNHSGGASRTMEFYLV